MKTFKSNFSFLLPFFLVLFFSTSLSALDPISVTDNFNSNLDGWSGEDVYQTSGKMIVPKDRETKKTYDFGSDYANKTVIVSYKVYLTNAWDNYGWSHDTFYYGVNNWEAYSSFYSGGGIYTKSFTYTLDNNGEIEVNFYIGSNRNDEYAEFDWVKIEWSPPPPPTVTPETFNIYQGATVGEVIGTVSATESPISFSIESGDIDSLFNIDNSGNITVAAVLDTNTSSSYDLNVSATNAYGTGSATITITLDDDIPLSVAAVNERPFTNVLIDGKESLTINGSILQIGNQLICRNGSYSNGGNGSDGADCLAPTEDTPNNSWWQFYARVDASASSPSNNTMARLNLLGGDEIVYAGLYWSARIKGITPTEKNNAKNIQIKGPGDTIYTGFTSKNAKYNWHSDSSIFDYVASANVTNYVRSHLAGDYYVGGITAESGSSGTYASWQLIVVVKNNDRSLKNIAIYDGFYSIHAYTNGSRISGYEPSVTVPANNFITPTGTDEFNANLFIYGGESDASYNDTSEILRKDNGTDTWISLVDGAGTEDDVMNASIYSLDYTNDGYRSSESDDIANPNFRNVLGVDIDKLSINLKGAIPSKQTLANSQTSTSIKISSFGDRYSLNMFAFETEVFVPEFCYDYAYKQQGSYFTENNDGSNHPRLVGSVAPNKKIEVSIFLKSMVDSAMQIQNMTIDVTDINRTQAPYIVNSAKLSKVGQGSATPISVTLTSSSTDDNLTNINIGTLNQNDYFYFYYDLNATGISVDMPINIRAKYNLVLDSTSVDYDLELDQQIGLCSETGFVYTPAHGMFNIVDNNYYTWDGSSGNKYYNIPTQITKREGNFKVLNMVPDGIYNTLNTSHPITVAAVEMIDAGAFHYTDASCTQLSSAISDRIWVIFDENIPSVPFDQTAIQAAISNGMTNLTSSNDFYNTARQNAAFRVTYNATDENGSIVQLEPISGSSGTRYNVANFPSLSGNCLQDMDNNINSTDTTSQYCSNAGTSYNSAMDKEKLTNCMECIYGLNTRFTCSRDNFSIRPEAFLIKINDQNQTTMASKSRISDATSGVTSTPDTTQIELAASYIYNLELNATNHLNNEASFGYNFSYERAPYLWNGLATCANDTADKNVSENTYISFLNGISNTNTDVHQVGRYTLNLTDKEWTVVDSNPCFMTHHNDANYFILPSSCPNPNVITIDTTSSDCIKESSITQAVGSSVKNGCWISSNHNASSTNLKYRDYDIEFHPYKFGINHSVKIGLNNLVPGANPYVYMADIGNDENMSVQIDANITALGYNGTTSLNNFVEGCYVKPLTLIIRKTGAVNTKLNYKFVLNDFNSTGNKVHTQTNTIAYNASPSIMTDNTYFKEDLNGGINTTIHMNFDRNMSVANPEDINYTIYSVKDTANTFYADLTTKSADSNVTINQSVRHYYGRTHASRQRYEVPTDAPYRSNIYYEVYCFGDTNGSVCSDDFKASLTTTNNLSDIKRTDDMRWYINFNHNTANDGTVTLNNVNESNSRTLVTETNRDVTTPYITKVELTYSGTDYPYKTTMENGASKWLIYNEDNPSAIKNSFSVEFDKGVTGWSGEHNTSTTTQSNGSIKTNRRSQW